MTSRTTRLMLVDDHEVLREGLTFMLRVEPVLAVVAEAGSGREALESLEAALPDVVLLDVKMPDVGGLETLRRIRERWPELPVLVLTMYDDPEYVDQALQAGASGYVLKSIGREELVRAVRAVSGGGGYLQAEITRPVLARFARMAPMPERAPHLSPRELDVLRLLAEGRSNRQMARDLGITEATVKGYLRELFEKLGASDRAHAVALALRTRLIE
ncbi:MAG: response regulator transcription factor [Actinobacteria bacterium]|nr:response regulator transcription factor [Actinomycetota bacterium]